LCGQDVSALFGCVFLGEGKVAKRMVALVVAGAILCITANLSAEVYFENKTDPCGCFVDDLDVYNGDYYWYVDADETSVVDIFGGMIDELVPFGFSTANIAGGLTKKLDALQYSTVNVSGGKISDLSAYGQSELSITGGEVSWLYVSADSQAIVLEGDVGHIWAESLSTVDIYGYDLSYEPYHNYDGTREIWEGRLTGFWQNEVSFGITTWDQETYDHLVLHDLGPLPGIPEPATLLLLGLGVLALRRKG
jgi:hypothetical protein